jgi:hypothetical protein
MNYIGIDVAKEELVVYGGKKEYVCRNTRGVPELEKYLTGLFPSFDDMIISFEATWSILTVSHRVLCTCQHQGMDHQSPEKCFIYESPGESLKDRHH